MATTINRTNIAMLSREMRNNDWRINGLERKLDALNTKLNELLEEGVDGGSGGDNTGGDTGGGDTGGGSGGKLTFKLNENIRFYITTQQTRDKRYSVYTTTQSFNCAPTAIDSIDAVYLVNNDTSFESSELANFTGGDWRDYLSSDYTIRLGDTLYTTSESSRRPPYSIANMETDNGSPRTIFIAYSQGIDVQTKDQTVRTIGTPAIMPKRILLFSGGSTGSSSVENFFEVTTDFFGTDVTEDYTNKGILEWSTSNNSYILTDNMQLLDSVTSNMYVMIMASGIYADAFELSYH